MRTSRMAIVALLAAAAPTLAGAQAGAKLAIGTIRGDATQVRRQILLQICEAYSCVAASRYTTGDRPDPAKLASAGVAGYLGGAVTGTRGQKQLFLTLTTPSSTAARPARAWKLRIGPDGRLSARALQQLASELDVILRGEAARAPPTPAAPPQRPPPPPPPAAAKPPPPPPKAPPSAAKAPPARPSEPRERERERTRTPRAAGAPVRFAAEAGLWFTGRQLGYSGVTGGVLRTFDAKAIFVPTGRIELYPAAIAGNEGMFAGLGLRAEYGRSFGLQVKPPDGSVEGQHEATLTAMRLALLWRVRPMAGSKLALVPAVGYRRLQLVTAAKSGVRIDSLPDADLTGWDARLDLEAPVGGVTLLVGGGYTMWTKAEELLGSAYYGSGSARGIEVEGGLAFRLVGPLALRAVAVYDTTSYSGLGDPAAGRATASGASDKYLGARLTVRAEY